MSSNRVCWESTRETEHTAPVLLLISPAAQPFLLFGHSERELIPQRRAAAGAYRNEASQHTRGIISTPCSLTFPYSTTLLHQHNGLWTTWGYRGSSLIHKCCKKPIIYFHLWFWQQHPGLALPQLIRVCSNISLLSYCFHPPILFFISVPFSFSFVFLKHNIPSLCDLVPPLF